MFTVIGETLDFLAAAFAEGGSGPLAGMAQELVVLVVFSVSFLALRCVAERCPTIAQNLFLSVDQRSDKVDSLQTAKGRRHQTSDSSQPKVSYKQEEQRMIQLLESREFTQALNLYRVLERDVNDACFSEGLYLKFIQSAARVGKADVAERMIRAMKYQGLVPSVEFWQAILKLLLSRKHHSTCLLGYQLFGKQIPSDKVVFSCFINAALDAGAKERAITMLDRYQEADLGSRDYILFFRVYAAVNDLSSAEAVFRKLGPDVTTLMLNLLLLICVNLKMPQRALDLLLEAHSLETRCKDEGDRIVDIISYNTVVKGFAQAGNWKQCCECVRSALSHKLEPNDVTISALMDLCTAGKDTSWTNEILDVMAGSGSLPMEAAAWCQIFTKALVRAGYLDAALELYSKLKGLGVCLPDVATYSMLVKALCDQHQIEDALKILKDSIAAGHLPDDIIFTHLLEGCRHEAKHHLGKQLFKEMLDCGIKPSEFTIIALLKLHGRCGAHSEAHELVAGCERLYGMKPTVILYTCLMSGCLRTKNYDQAWHAYELMKADGIQADDTTYSTLLPALVLAQQWKRVVVFTRDCCEASAPRIKLPIEALNNAVAQMSAHPSLSDLTNELQELMAKAGVPIRQKTTKPPNAR
eukprot:TRINITY_DN67495_c0_g1_i1.p1 TRINITY_DN67495_c0_g1~~TRINITY_DN67495_c0_g1_i1.p1  ORF type:complete len:639 (+),score=107.40 TRINITY_DN67495_c0_g1_i1:113-2029(+)